MENLIKQIRVKLIGAEEEDNIAGLGGSRDQKILIQKTPSFKEKKTAQNWIQRQLLSRKMSHDYDSTEMEHATAIAAAAFAISSQFSEIPQKKKSSDPPETSFTKTTSKVDGKKTPISQLADAVSKRFSVGSFKITDEQDNKVPTSPIIREEKKPESTKKTPTFSEKSKRTDDKKPDIPAPKKTPTFGDQQHFMNTDDAKPETPKPKVPQLVDPTVPLRPPPPPPPPPQSPIGQTSTSARPPTRAGATETKADAWEREKHRKIKERYEKLLETIDSWEKRKKMKARRKLNKHEQSESGRKGGGSGRKAWRKYEDKIKYIDEIAAGARAQADERRRNEALKAKEKANIIRTTGKLPGPCSCF